MASARRIGPYDVVREIARGGMGIVYEVRHPQINRRLALKMILNAEGPRAAEHAQRFEREAEILARCDRHPHVLKVHQLGKLEDRLFLVTEFVEGDSLQRHIPMPARQAATVIRKVADALAYIHERGVLHRDLKPDNILLRADDPDSPVLVDFGLAWVGDVERLTRTGTTLGTPAFMSPEQAGSGHGLSLDARTDVYSLGATLYAALTGDGPFVADSMSALVAKILTEPPRPASEVTPDIPRGLDAICLHALAKDPAKRYRDAVALRDDLDRFLRGEAPLALALLPTPPRVHLKRAVLGLVAVALGFGIVTVRARQKRAAHESALAAATEAGHVAAKARRGGGAGEALAGLERALAALDATRAARGDAPDPATTRIHVVAALLRAEAAAREPGTGEERARSLGRAAAATREYLSGVSTLSAPDGRSRGSGSSGSSATGSGSTGTSADADPDLDDLVEREAALAAALATWSQDDEVTRALLARPEPREPSRAARLDRARALLALGEPAPAQRLAELVSGEDATAGEARLIAARASLELDDPGRARALVATLATAAPDATIRARAAALLAPIELARGETLAAQDALDAVVEPPRRGGGGPELVPELELARVAVGLARGVPPSVLGRELEALEKRLHDPALAPRLAELEGRVRLLAAFESLGDRRELPKLDEARAAFLRAVELGAEPGGAAARPAVAEALLTLAALDEVGGHGAEAMAGRLRAVALVPASTAAVLALLDESGGPRVPAPELIRALERTASAVADETVAIALRAIATAVRAGGPAKTAAAALQAPLIGASAARTRGLFGLLDARLGTHPDRGEGAAAAALSHLRRCGSLEALLVDAGRERVELARHAEAYFLHAVATMRAHEHDDNPPWGRGSPGEIQDGTAAAQGSARRGDAALAIVALDLALALRPSLVVGVRERARAVAQAIRGSRPDLEEAKALGLDSEPTRTVLGADGGLARARVALAGLEAVDVPGSLLAQADGLLARGRLLLFLKKESDAITVLHEAHEAATSFLSAESNADRPSRAKIAAASAIESEALEEIANAQSSALDASGARGDAAQDLEDRGASVIKALGQVERLEKLEEELGDLGGRKPDLAGACAQACHDVLAQLRLAPFCADALGKCAASQLTAGSVVLSYLTHHEALALRGPLPVNFMILRRDYGPHFRKESDVSQLTVAQIKASTPDSADDAVALAAASSRGLFGLPTGPDSSERRAAARRIEDELQSAATLAPAFEALGGFRAFADVAAGELESARARFARLEPLATGSEATRKWLLTFETMVFARFGCADDARRALEALRDTQELSAADAVAIRVEAFDDVRAIPALVPIIKEIDERFLNKH